MRPYGLVGTAQRVKTHTRLQGQSFSFGRIRKGKGKGVDGWNL